MDASNEWDARSEERYIDKAEWPRGEWDSEADRIEWRYHGAERYPLLIVRNRGGALCGYVGVPPGHPYHGVNYDDIRPYPECHGGLTYGAPCQAGGEICHVARDGEPDDVFWFGFDCAHCDDLSPGYVNIGGRTYDYGRDEYRSVSYVRHHVEKLAEQFALAARGELPDDE